MPKRAAPPGDPRERLLDAAYSVVAEKGLEGLRTREVVSRAGVNISTLHYYFGTKEDLVLAVVDHVRDRFSSGAPGEGKPSLERHLAMAWKNFQEDPRLPRVLQELAQRASREAPVRQAFRKLFKHWHAMVEDAVRADFPGAKASALASIVTSFVMGSMTQLSIDETAFDFHQVSAELLRLFASSGGRDTARRSRT